MSLLEMMDEKNREPIETRMVRRNLCAYEQVENYDVMEKIQQTHRNDVIQARLPKYLAMHAQGRKMYHMRPRTLQILVRMDRGGECSNNAYVDYNRDEERILTKRVLRYT